MFPLSVNGSHRERTQREKSLVRYEPIGGFGLEVLRNAINS